MAIGNLACRLKVRQKVCLNWKFLPNGEAILERYLSSHRGRMDGRKRFWSQLSNSKTVKDGPYALMGSYRMGPSPTPSNLLPKRAAKSPTFKFHWRSTKMSVEHVLGPICRLWSDAMNSRTAFAKAANEWKQIKHNMCSRRATWLITIVVMTLSVSAFFFSSYLTLALGWAIGCHMKNMMAGTFVHIISLPTC